MKASFALALTGAFLAVASPIDKRVIHTEYVTDLVYVTVTVDPTTAKPTTHHTTHAKPKTTSIKTTSTTPPPPPPTTTSTPPPPPPTTSSTVQAQAEAITITVTPGAETEAAASTTTPAAVQPAVAQVPAEESSSPAAAATTAAATTAAASTEQPTDFGSTAVYHHNLHRTNHSAPAVSWNSDLADYAATVAASCVFAHDLTPGGGGYGQNIAVYGASGDVESMDSSKIVAQAITDMWYNGEVWQYPADGYGQSSPDMSNFEAWGHFSQVVWVASTEIGCASQYCAPGTIYSGMGSWFTVCDYKSAGNLDGAYGDNVLPSLGEATVTV